MNVKGIVINAFSDPFVVPIEICNIVEKLKSGLEGREELKRIFWEFVPAEKR